MSLFFKEYGVKSVKGFTFCSFFTIYPLFIKTKKNTSVWAWLFVIPYSLIIIKIINFSTIFVAKNDIRLIIS